jgi:hypothetical protein
MSIISVLEQIDGRTADADQYAERNYTRKWRVVCDSLEDSNLTAETAQGLPLLFDTYIGSDGLYDILGATLHKYTSECVEPFVFDVTAHYSNKTQQKEKGDKNPLNRPTEISADGVTFQKAIDFTPAGVPVCSSTGERFDPPVTRDDSRRAYTYSRKEAQSPELVANVYKDVVNSDNWLGYPPGTAKVGVIKVARADENNQFYYKTTYPISIDLDGWDARPMDLGTKWLDFSDNPTGDQKGFFDAHGNPLSGSQPLNGEGGPLYPQGVGGNIAQGACSLLSNSVGIADTTITVGVASGFPQQSGTYPIVLKIDSELLQATSLVGTTFTVVRGYGGSSPAEHFSLRVVQMQPYYFTFQRYRRLPFAALNLP